MQSKLSDTTYRAVLEGLPVGVYLVGCNRQIVLWNDGAERLTGYPRHEVIGRCCADDLLMHCDEAGTVLCGNGCPLQGAIHDGKPREARVFLRHKAGHRVPVQIRAVPLRDESGTIIGAAETFDLCAARVPPRFDAEAIASLTPTGLPDRPYMEAWIAASLKEFAAGQLTFGLLSMTIDHLDHLRKADGPVAAETIVRVAAGTLSANRGPLDLVGQWSDDQFVAVVGDCTRASLRQRAEAWRVLADSSAAPWWGDRIAMTLSIGGTIVQSGDTPESLVHRAEEALQRSLSDGGDRVIVD